jgi:hypothetical protein
MKYLIILPLLLAACGDTGQSIYSASKPPQIVYPNFTFHIREAPDQLKPEQKGTATILQFPSGERACAIVLRKYPQCLLHEIRHCIEGEWHDREVPNDEDCD